jgi:hypothetical protein
VSTGSLREAKREGKSSAVTEVHILKIFILSSEFIQISVLIRTFASCYMKQERHK